MTTRLIAIVPFVMAKVEFLQATDKVGIMTIADYKYMFRHMPELFFNLGDLSLADAEIAADYVDHALPPQYPQGLPGLRQFVTLFRAGMPDVHYTVDHLTADDLIGEGDKGGPTNTAPRAEPTPGSCSVFQRPAGKSDGRKSIPAATRTVNSFSTGVMFTFRAYFNKWVPCPRRLEAGRDCRRQYRRPLLGARRLHPKRTKP